MLIYKRNGFEFQDGDRVEADIHQRFGHSLVTYRLTGTFRFVNGKKPCLAVERDDEVRAARRAQRGDAGGRRPQERHRAEQVAE